uniref:Uncharacterized protein n=1 Tax=Anguilla anguilla TaxID=7936 RepID=A0A0E9PCN4_ANGAN
MSPCNRSAVLWKVPPSVTALF